MENDLIKIIINGKEIYFYNIELENKDRNIEVVKKWCEERIMPYKSTAINYKHSSYELKHICERELGFYVSNGTLKNALAQFDIRYKQQKDSPNYCYAIKPNFWKDKFFSLNKSEITSIKQKEDVDIIYTNNTFYICKKNSIRNVGEKTYFQYATKSEDR